MAFISQSVNYNGCALAAIASVMDMNYYAALDKLKRPNLDPNDGLYIEQIRACFKRLGKKIGPSIYVPKKNRNETWIRRFALKQKHSCIFCVDNEDGSTFHCVVWDAKVKTFWDPAAEGSFEFYKDEFKSVYRIIVAK